jgi:hypothetical protein
LAATNGSGILMQSMTGFLATTTHRNDDILWCTACNRWVHSNENHLQTLKHNHNCGISVVQTSATTVQNALSENEFAGQL